MGRLTYDPVANAASFYMSMVVAMTPTVSWGSAVSMEAALVQCSVQHLLTLEGDP